MSRFISRHRLMWLLLIGVVAIAVDQSSKMWAQQVLAQRWESGDSVVHYFPKQEIVVVPEVFNLVYRENPAAAFSITKSIPDWFRRPFLLCVSSLATIFFLIWYFRVKDEDGLLLTAFCLIMAGAVGNLIDRATLGYVIDFLDVYAGVLGYPNLHWPTFNVADSCIVVGAMGVLYRTFRPFSA
jgi:signal peptidase II